MFNDTTEYRKDHRFGGSLFTLIPVQKGQVVCTFDGEFYDWGTNLLNLPNDSPSYVRDHAIQFAAGKSRDSAEGLGRYANHSCSPNCGIKDLFNVVAMRDIPAGVEITWDYAMTENNDWFMSCSCGSPRCRKLITGFRHLPPEFRREYEGYISQWLIDANIPFEGHALSEFTPMALMRAPDLQNIPTLRPAASYTFEAPRAS